MNETDKKRFKTSLLFAAAVIVIYAAVTNLNSVVGFFMTIISILSPLLTGVFLALILGTPMRKLEQLFGFLSKRSKAKKKMSEKATTYICLILTYILALVAIGFVIGILIPAVSDSAREIVATVTRLWPKAVEFLKEKGINTSQLEGLMKNLNIENIMLSFTSNLGNVFDTLIHSVNGIITIAVNLVTTVIFSIYLLANKRKLKDQSTRIVNAYFPEKKAPRILYVLDLIITTFSKFFSGQCLEAIILGCIFLIVLSITGFPYAPVISLIIGITAFIPYVGAFIGCFVGTLLILMDSGLVMALIFIAVFLVIQQLENNLIYPRVVGTSIGLPAMWTFAALIVGGAVYGVVGMLVFIPITSIAYTLIKNDVAARLKQKEEARASASEEERSNS